MIRSAFAWVGKNAAIITAACSMFIAGLSLYFTVQAQQADLHYKELSVEPRAELGGDENLGVRLESIGLGPLVVHRIDVRIGDKCVSSKSMNAEQWIDAFDEFIRSAAGELYERTLPDMPWLENRNRYSLTSGTLQPGDVLRPGAVRQLIKIDPEVLTEFKKLPSAQQADTLTKFIMAAYGLPIRIVSCSVSGLTCGEIGNFVGCGSP